MAFVKKTWKDRIVQYANRRLLTKSGGEVEQVTVTRDEGTISEAGDQFNASNMNDLEQRVKDGFDGLTADTLPIQSGSSTNTKDYIDTRLSGKADIVTVKQVAIDTAISVSANAIDTQTLTVNDAVYGIVTGFAITNSSEIVMMQCYFNGTSSISLRVKNVANSTQTYKATIQYI